MSGSGHKAAPLPHPVRTRNVFVAGPIRRKEKEKMEEIIRTNDLVLISFIESLLREAGINFVVADQNMSVIEGSLGILPRRILVPTDSAEEARGILTEAGVGAELRPASGKPN
jgi:hypothetical protein